MDYPQAFIDYLCDKFGLEWLDYADDMCYQEWCELQKA